MGARVTNLDKAVYPLLFLSLFLYIHSTCMAFVQTPTHHYLLSLPVNLQVMFLEPSKPEDDILLPEVSGCKGHVFHVSIMPEDCFYNFRDQSCLITNSINIEDWDGTL